MCSLYYGFNKVIYLAFLVLSVNEHVWDNDSYGKVDQFSWPHVYFTDRQKWKSYTSQSTALGGEETGQDKSIEKKSVTLIRREK